MKSKPVLILIVAFQILILAGMLATAMRPLFTGREIRLEVIPRDPRDFFRGSYVALNYDFNNLHLDSIPNDIPAQAQYSYGDVLYIELKQSGDVFRAAGLWQEPPEAATFLKAMVMHNYYPGNPYIRLSCGIESYFTGRDMARSMEERLLNSIAGNQAFEPVTVSVMVTPDGDARLKAIHFQEGK